MKHPDALLFARKYQELIRPFCERVEIAGSLRRNKPEVKDIDIVCQPKVEHVPADLFGKTTCPAIPLYSFLNDMQKSGDLVKNKGKERYFQFQTNEGITLELYCVLPPAQWGVIFTLRTGPDDFGHWFVTIRKQGGALPSNASVRDGGVHVNGKLIPMPEEMDLLNFLGLGWIEPCDRVARWHSKPLRDLLPDSLVIGNNKS